jgi:protein-S-isoprenylcysteine O-methyltransferase
VSGQPFPEQSAAALALVVGAGVANLAMEWIVTARERLAAPDAAGRIRVLSSTLVEVTTSHTQAGDSDDRGTKRILVGAMTAALILAWWTAVRFPGAELPAAWRWPAAIAGSALIVAGGVLRTWGIATLGRFFRRDVTIQAGHRLVTSGPYRLVRHPAYAGNVLAAVGFGLALANWVSVLVATAVAIAGHLPRIRVEERAMGDALGDEWVQYAATTDRIMPGVW